MAQPSSSRKSPIFQNPELRSDSVSESDSLTDSSEGNYENPLCNSMFPIFTPTTDNHSSYDWVPDSDSDCDSHPDMYSLVTDLFADRSDKFETYDHENCVFDPVSELSQVSYDGVFADGSSNVGGPSVESRSSGLRVAGIDSDSDAEYEGIDIHFGDNVGHSEQGSAENVDITTFMNNFHIDDGERNNGEEIFDWEQINGGNMESRNVSLPSNLSEHLSVSSEISDEDYHGEEAIRNLWQILVMVNSLERTIIATDEVDSDPHLAVQDDLMYAVGYNTHFEQFMETEAALKGSPPAAKSVVENLPLVELENEDVKESCVGCAVCKNDISLKEKVRRLPCLHYYHDDCIIPWLSIRNTCPVCRYELPTDDSEYEQTKNRGSGQSIGDLGVRYDLL